MATPAIGNGTPGSHWTLVTPPGSSEFQAYRDPADNPVAGWYGRKKGLRGRFGMYVPPVLEALGLAEVEHNPRNNRMRAL